METIGIAVLIIVIAIIVFLITREFWCWYWKINEMKELLKSIDQKLNNNVKDGNNNTEKKSSVEIKDGNEEGEDEIIMKTPVWICEACETENSGEICSNCGAKKSKIIV